MVKYGDKVYNQSHYSGRRGMASIGADVTRMNNVINKFKTQNRSEPEGV